MRTGTRVEAKSGRVRYVPMTVELAGVLRGNRHVRGELVLYREDGNPFTEAAIRAATDRAARVAELRRRGLHLLRHTFCSQLGDEGGASTVDSGVGRASERSDHAAIHAPESGCS
jgi:integrase